MSDVMKPTRLNTEQTVENAVKIMEKGVLEVGLTQVDLDGHYVDIYLLVDKPGTVEMRWYAKGTAKPPAPRAKHEVWEP